VKNLKNIKRSLSVIALILLLSISFSANLFAGDLDLITGDKDEVEQKLKAAEENLIQSLKGDNDNLKESAIQVILELKQAYPEFKFNKAVIPLMRILRQHENQNIRILAALTLYELGNESGVYAVKEASKFDDNKMVRHICSSLTNKKSEQQQQQAFDGMASINK